MIRAKHGVYILFEKEEGKAYIYRTLGDLRRDKNAVEVKLPKHIGHLAELITELESQAIPVEPHEMAPDCLLRVVKK